MITLRAIGPDPGRAMLRGSPIRESDELLIAFEAGASLMDLARRLGVAKSTVRGRLQRARQRRRERAR